MDFHTLLHQKMYILAARFLVVSALVDCFLVWVLLKKSRVFLALGKNLLLALYLRV